MAKLNISGVEDYTPLMKVGVAGRSYLGNKYLTLTVTTKEHNSDSRTNLPGDNREKYHTQSCSSLCQLEKTSMPTRSLTISQSFQGGHLRGRSGMRQRSHAFYRGKSIVEVMTLS